MIERNERNNCELFVTCSDPCERNERNTPLGGVTIVRGVGVVPMVAFLSEGGVAGGGYAFSLCGDSSIYFFVFSAIIFRLSTISAIARSTAYATRPWTAAGPYIIGVPEVTAMYMANIITINEPAAITLNNIFLSYSFYNCGGQHT